jgi:hypothetical protein
MRIKNMKKLLYATVALAALALPAQAAVIRDLGINPVSSTANVNNSVFGGLFLDQYTFQLVGSPQFITFASATNVFIDEDDFITNFTGQLFQQVGVIDGFNGINGDDDILLSVAEATPCQQNPTGCQVLAGSAILAAGNYYLQITGYGGGTAGYGGNLTTAPLNPIPIPGMALAVPLGALGLAWFARRRKRA